MSHHRLSQYFLALCALWTVGAPGCDRQAVGAIDSSNQKTDASVHDAQSDARPHDGGEDCQHGDWWEKVATRIEAANVEPAITNDGWYPEGIGVRVEVQVSVSVCKRFATVDVEQPADRQSIVLTAYVWAYRGDAHCPFDPHPESEWIVLSDLDPGDWTILDGADPTTGPGQNTVAAFTVAPCNAPQDCHCQQGGRFERKEGDSCHFDCECDYDLSCVYGFQSDFSHGTCLRTCSTNSQCPLPQRCVLDLMNYPTGICGNARSQCQSDSDCPASFSCMEHGDDGRYCVPRQDITLDGTICSDGCDCGAGYACIRMNNEDTRTCHVPCRGNGDCFNDAFCARGRNVYSSGRCVFVYPDDR